MTMSDPIADFLTRIRNALRAQHRYVDVPWSKLKENIAEILKEEKLIESYTVTKEKSYGTMRILLKYTFGQKPVIQGLERISRPGLRKYISHRDIVEYYGGFGITILSTPKGVISGRQAKESRVGGELVCKVW